MQKVGIIIRTSTRYLFLERTLLDIKNQTFKDWKMIIVNDGGELERIRALLKKHEIPKEQYVLLHSDQNNGLHKAINIGAKAVQEPFVIVHDDDDTWDARFLERTIAYLEEKPTCKGIITHSNKIYEKIEQDQIKKIKETPFNHELKGVLSMYDMMKNNLYSPISFIYRSEVYNEIGYFDESLEVLEDWEFNLRFLMKYDIEVLEEVLAYYHIRKQTNIQDSFKNTVVDKKNLHEKYDTIIRNRYLRKDFEEGKMGLGIMINLLKWSDGKVLRKLKKYIKR